MGETKTTVDAIIAKLKEIIVVNEKTSIYKAKCQTLVNRIEQTKFCFLGLQMSTPSTERYLVKFLEYLEEFVGYLRKIQAPDYFDSVWRRNSDKERFADFNSDLSVRIKKLKFDLPTENKKQFETDNNIDTAFLMATVMEILSKEGKLQNEIDSILQDLAETELRQINMPISKFKAPSGQLVGQLSVISSGSQILHVDAPPELKTLETTDIVCDTTEHSNTLVGKGSFGSVNKGEYKNKHVAVKYVQIFKKISTNEQFEEQKVALANELRKEALTMQLASGPGIVRFYGAQLTQLPYFIVTELAQCSLHDLLYKPQTAESIHGLSLTLPLQLSLMFDCSSALQYLHSLDIVHCDIKPENVLISSHNLHVKVTDFGFTQVKQMVSKHGNIKYNNELKGTVLYMSPEILINKATVVYTLESDMFAFAVLLNEVLTGVVPYSELNLEDQDAFRGQMFIEHSELRPLIYGANLPPVPGDGVMVEIQEMIQFGWHKFTSYRHSFREVSAQLRRLISVVGGDPRTTHVLPTPLRSPNKTKVQNTAHNAQLKELISLNTEELCALLTNVSMDVFCAPFRAHHVTGLVLSNNCETVEAILKLGGEHVVLPHAKALSLHILEWQLKGVDSALLCVFG